MLEWEKCAENTMLKWYATLSGGVKCSGLLDTKVSYALPQNVAYYSMLYLKAYYATL